MHRGFDVTVIEMGDQVLAPLDREMARIVEGYVEQHGIHLALNDAVAGFKQDANGALDVLTKSGDAHPADIVILALGVRPIPLSRRWLGWKSASAAGFASTSTCARVTRISSRSVTPSK